MFYGQIRMSKMIQTTTITILFTMSLTTTRAYSIRTCTQYCSMYKVWHEMEICDTYCCGDDDFKYCCEGAVSKIDQKNNEPHMKASCELRTLSSNNTLIISTVVPTVVMCVMIICILIYRKNYHAAVNNGSGVQRHVIYTATSTQSNVYQPPVGYIPPPGVVYNQQYFQQSHPSPVQQQAPMRVIHQPELHPNYQQQSPIGAVHQPSMSPYRATPIIPSHSPYPVTMHSTDTPPPPYESVAHIGR